MAFARARALLYSISLIVQWLSSSLIILNKHILSERGFHFPLTLVMLHMAFGSAASTAWRALGWVEVPPLTLAEWAAKFLPVGFCFAISMGAGNAAYLYISVAFVQMLKASTPVAVLLTAFAFGLGKPTLRLALYIVLISGGVASACAAQLDPSAVGVAVQLVAVVAVAMRLCLVNVLLVSRGMKLAPIAMTYFACPACFLWLLPGWLATEAVHHHAIVHAAIARVGMPLLVFNSSLAFLLNLATMALI